MTQIAQSRLVLIAAAMLVIPQSAEAEQSYSRGQNASPAYEGWEEDTDGSRYFLFGYINRNWEEVLDVPVGPENYFEPGDADQGQPTHFFPRRNRFVFHVPVPDDFSETDELVWTLTTKGKEEKAYATLRLDSFVDNLVKASEQGALGAGTSDSNMRGNTVPQLRVEGAAHRTARVGEPLTLVAWASDDGIPKPGKGGGSFPRARNSGTFSTARPEWTPPRQITVGSSVGLRLSWFVYRGAGQVTFDPLQAKVWEDTRDGANSPWANRWVTPPLPPDGRWEVEVTFHAPGTYILRCLASDGAVGADEDRTITVTR
ncbi:MAG: hypothetical protein CL489_00080 [Acidobacteria bacterium]|jgi:hypothetical protein|nr:hypothetical protein [Acidobacteriota bacterium]MBF82849.1 hypothetical protein [Acidobacteriota bacterium]